MSPEENICLPLRSTCPQRMGHPRQPLAPFPHRKAAVTKAAEIHNHCKGKLPSKRLSRYPRAGRRRWLRLGRPRMLRWICGGGGGMKSWWVDPGLPTL